MVEKQTRCGCVEGNGNLQCCGDRQKDKEIPDLRVDESIADSWNGRAGLWTCKVENQSAKKTLVHLKEASSSL